MNKMLGQIAFEGASDPEHAEHLEIWWQQLVQAEPGEFAIEARQWEAAAQAVRRAVIEECAKVAKDHFDFAEDLDDPLAEGYRSAAINIEAELRGRLK